MGRHRKSGDAAEAARAELRPGNCCHADRGMGGGRLSLVGAVESAATGLDAVDPQALPVAAGDREAAVTDQRAADGPSAAGAEDATAA